jgi:hypothetical protein
MEGVAAWRVIIPSLSYLADHVLESKTRLAYWKQISGVSVSYEFCWKPMQLLSLSLVCHEFHAMLSAIKYAHFAFRFAYQNINYSSLIS